MNPYEYVVLVCGTSGGSDFSQVFEESDQAFDFCETMAQDKYVSTCHVIRGYKGQWRGKQPGQCAINVNIQ